MGPPEYGIGVVVRVYHSIEWEETMVGEMLVPYGEADGCHVLYLLWNMDGRRLVEMSVCRWIVRLGR